MANGVLSFQVQREISPLAARDFFLVGRAGPRGREPDGGWADFGKACSRCAFPGLHCVSSRLPVLEEAYVY